MSKTETITAEVVTDSLPSITAAEIATINGFHHSAHSAAETARQKAQEASHFAVLCGVRLEALKQSCQHGQWGQLFSKKPKNLTANPSHIGPCEEFEFSLPTADRYIELARRLRLEQQLSGKAQKRLATIAAEPELADESRQWLEKLTEGRNLRQLYLDLDIITAPDKADKPAGPPPGPRKTEKQSKLEDAREHWFTWREKGEQLVQIGCLDHLDKAGLEQMKEFQGWLRDRINARLKTL